MKLILFLKTETTGLPPRKKLTKKNSEKWPHLVALHYKIGHYDKLSNKINIINKGYYIVKPDNYEIPKISIKFHNITNEIANNKGYDLKKVLNKFFNDINDVKFIVGHNIPFDLNIIKSEILRNNLDHDLDDKNIIDIMNFNHDYEFPKLEYLFEKLHGHKFKKSHPRKSNINIIIKCFEKLYNNRVISKN